MDTVEIPRGDKNIRTLQDFELWHGWAYNEVRWNKDELRHTLDTLDRLCFYNADCRLRWNYSCKLKPGFCKQGGVFFFSTLLSARKC
jgi:hypothetical protein